MLGRLCFSFLLTSPLLPAQIPSPFGVATLAPAFEVDGAGLTVDSIAFWEAPDPNDTLMFVTAKGNDVVEVWRFPFANNELPPLQFPANVNGVAVDQERDLLYVSDRVVSVFSLPDLQPVGEFGAGILGVGEHSIDILQVSGGRSILYVTDYRNVHRFNGRTWDYFGSFAPPVSSMESVLADSFHQIIHIPEERGPAGNPGVYTYHPNGTPFERNGSNRYGNNGEFGADEEGITLYTFPIHGQSDDGSGFIVVSDQHASGTQFEVFDRQSGTHLGQILLTGVSNTDGIASTQRPLPGYPMGLFGAINNDTSTALVGWDAVFTAIGWDLPPAAMSIVPETPGPTSGNRIDFTVVFSEPVTNFNDGADVQITHSGTAHSGVTIAGTGTHYTVSVTGISGAGSFTLAVDPASDLQDSAAQAFSAGVTSAPVTVTSPYHSWAAAQGLATGLNDDPAGDPDNDGCPNLKEFALNSDPLRRDHEPRTRVELAEFRATRHLTITFPARSGAVFTGDQLRAAAVDGLLYSLGATDDLSSFGLTLEEINPPRSTELATLDPGWTYHTFRLVAPLADLTSAFVCLEIQSTAP